MKNKYTLVIAAPIAVFLTSAFIAWDINPSHWDLSGRFICGILMFILFVAASSPIFDNES